MSHSEDSIARRLDRLPIGTFHRKILGMIGIGIFLDSFELQMAGAILGALLASKWSTPDLNAWFISATFMGFVVGCWASGVLGDRLGRRYCYQINLAVFGIASLLAAFAPNMYWLIALRFVMGVGLGGELVLGYATLGEFLPPKSRGRFVAILAFISQSALFVSACLAYWIIPNLGWRWMFGIVGVAAVGIWFLRKSMPESPRWLASKGRFEEADAIVAKAEADAGGAFTRPIAPRPAPPARTPGRTSDLFRQGQYPKIILGIAIMVTIQVCNYGLISWLPTFFVQQGLDIVKSLQWNMIMTLGGPTGALLSLLVVDRIGRKPILIGSSFLAVFFAVIYVNQTAELALMVSGFLMITFIYAIVVVGQAVYMPELFPTHLRMRGTGLCSAVARGFAALIPFAIPAIFNMGGIRLVVIIVGVELMLFALIVMLIGKETRQKSLELSSSL